MKDLFDVLKDVKEQLSEADVKKTVADIVNILKNINITYDCAHEILRITDQTLDEMKGSLKL